MLNNAFLFLSQKKSSNDFPMLNNIKGRALLMPSWNTSKMFVSNRESLPQSECKYTVVNSGDAQILGELEGIQMN